MQLFVAAKETIRNFVVSGWVVLQEFSARYGATTYNYGTSEEELHLVVACGSVGAAVGRCCYLGLER